MKKKSQLFCKNVSLDILYELINTVSTKTIVEDISNTIIEFYKIDKIIFKKLEFHGYIAKFIIKLKEYYYPNKQFYIERKMTYNNFLTIIRQLCKLNNVQLKKEIIYEKDTYQIEYYIYIKQS
tara:strand:- start:2044 stop:2412 length:369 start_codon:yes stop_codon:yes gene_type:complete